MASQFDIDLPIGQAREELVKQLLTDVVGVKIEVKTDFKVSDTGNVAIEYECRGKPSGISITQADWWAIVLDGDRFSSEVIVLIKTDRLKGIARKHFVLGKVVSGGDDNVSKMVLVPVIELIESAQGDP